MWHHCKFILFNWRLHFFALSFQNELLASQVASSLPTEVTADEIREVSSFNSPIRVLIKTGAIFSWFQNHIAKWESFHSLRLKLMMLLITGSNFKFISCRLARLWSSELIQPVKLFRSLASIFKVASVWVYFPTKFSFNGNEISHKNTQYSCS